MTYCGLNEIVLYIVEFLTKILSFSEPSLNSTIVQEIETEKIHSSEYEFSTSH